VIQALALFAQLAIAVHAPDAASACDVVEISVAASAPGNASPQVIPPSFGGFDILRSTVSPHVRYSREQNTTTVEYSYVLTNDHVGVYTIPSFEARLGNAVSRSRPVQIAITPATGRPPVPAVIARARVDTSLEVSFHALSKPETVYVGQQANYEVAVFLNSTVRDRLRRNPTFFPPDMQSMLAYDLPTRGVPPRRQVGEHCFDALVYQRALFPLMPGRFAIPPAQLVYSLPLSASFFSREETHELQTDSTVVVAMEPPVAGRPADYGGAVGSLRVAAKLDTSVSRVGDPMLLTVRVSGTGNVKLFPRPSVGVSWATLVKGDERVQVDTNARRIAGSKEFDWVLTPRIAGELDLPPIKYGYFNPDSRRYETALTNPTHVRVGPGTLASGDTSRTETLLPLRPRYRGPSGVPLHEHPVFWALLALTPIPALTLKERRRKGARGPSSERGTRPVPVMALLRDAGRSRSASEVRRAYTRALADRLGLSPDVFTRPGSLTRALRRRGVSTATAQDAERFLRELDEAAFSSAGAFPEDASRRAAKLCKTVDDEALPRDYGFGRMMSIIALVALSSIAGGVAIADAKGVADARRFFDDGVTAYGQHNFVSARESFMASVNAEPRAPDAWANLGTASWAVSDTARSVAAWQRALRMEPLAPDLRDRVELVHSLAWDSAGWVPPLPAAWVFNLGAGLWLVAWLLAAARGARQLAWRSFPLTIASAASILLLIAGFVLSDRASGRRVAVIRRTESLSVDPQLGGERGPTALIGEVVRVTGQQGAWVRARLDDGREGWVEGSAVIGLDGSVE
jgi:hypothetical protein